MRMPLGLRNVLALDQRKPHLADVEPFLRGHHQCAGNSLAENECERGQDQLELGFERLA